MHFSVLVVAAIAIYASHISNKQAERFIHGGIAPDRDVRQGSGKFFDSIAGTYDVLNQLISLGMHEGWRRRAIAAITPTASVLDVSTGTGDIAISLATDRSARVSAIDPSVEMLRVARRKIEIAGKSIGPVNIVEGVAERLPFDDDAFDSVIVSFGIRNFEDRQKGLSEMARVLTPGGRLAVLELSTPKDPGFVHHVSRFFINAVMPTLAGLVSGQKSHYQYLARSMGDFPDKEEFSKMLESAGLELTKHERLSPFGLGPDLYTATKRPPADSEASKSTEA